jgi:hypothetical protein
MEVRTCLLSQASVKDMLEKVWSLKADMQQKVILLMWCWWSMRNKMNVGAQEVVNDVLFYMQTWSSVFQNNISKIKDSQPKWKVPSEDFL